MIYKKYELLEITWLDSIHDSGWQKEDKFDGDDKWLGHTTAGYYFGQSKNAIHVIQSKSITPDSKGNRSIDSVMTIPKKCITNIKKLK